MWGDKGNKGNDYVNDKDRKVLRKKAEMRENNDKAEIITRKRKKD